MAPAVVVSIAVMSLSKDEESIVRASSPIPMEPKPTLRMSPHHSRTHAIAVKRRAETMVVMQQESTQPSRFIVATTLPCGM